VGFDLDPLASDEAVDQQPRLRAIGLVQFGRIHPVQPDSDTLATVADDSAGIAVMAGLGCGWPCGGPRCGERSTECDGACEHCAVDG